MRYRPVTVAGVLLLHSPAKAANSGIDWKRRWVRKPKTIGEIKEKNQEGQLDQANDVAVKGPSEEAVDDGGDGT